MKIASVECVQNAFPHIFPKTIDKLAPHPVTDPRSVFISALQFRDPYWLRNRQTLEWGTAATQRAPQGHRSRFTLRFRDLAFGSSRSNTASRSVSWYLPSQPPQRSSSNGITPRCSSRFARDRK